MGTWGSGVGQDDTVADIVGFVVDRLKAGDTMHSATEQALSRYAELMNDDDDGPLLWMALAKVQWKYGPLEPATGHPLVHARPPSKRAKAHLGRRQHWRRMVRPKGSKRARDLGPPWRPSVAFQGKA